MAIPLNDGPSNVVIFFAVAADTKGIRLETIRCVCCAAQLGETETDQDQTRSQSVGEFELDFAA